MRRVLVDIVRCPPDSGNADADPLHVRPDSRTGVSVPGQLQLEAEMGLLESEPGVEAVCIHPACVRRELHHPAASPSRLVDAPADQVSAKPGASLIAMHADCLDVGSRHPPVRETRHKRDLRRADDPSLASRDQEQLVWVCIDLGESLQVRLKVMRGFPVAPRMSSASMTTIA